jgi:hypothetical protein
VPLAALEAPLRRVWATYSLSPSEPTKHRFLQLSNTSATSYCRTGTKDTHFPLRLRNKRLLEMGKMNSFQGRLMPETTVSTEATQKHHAVERLRKRSECSKVHVSAKQGAFLWTDAERRSRLQEMERVRELGSERWNGKLFTIWTQWGPVWNETRDVHDGLYPETEIWSGAWTSEQMWGPHPVTGIASFFFYFYFTTSGPPMWSEFLATDPEARVRYPALPKKVMGLERGPLSLVSTTEELLNRKVAAPV